MTKLNFKIIIGSGLIFLGIGAGLFFYSRNPKALSHPALSPGTAHSIVLSKDGFIPPEITIHQGDTVIFTTTLGVDFWPASDPHPTHEIYPEFDPKQPIAQDKSWSFVFNRAGSFSYHDHLFFTHKGIINVLAQGQNSVAPKSCPKNLQDPQCWQDELDATLKNQGLDAAFSLLAQLYDTEPAFAAGCHGYTHILGQAAYELFDQHKDFNLSPKASYCGYGFYHGFMETLLKTSGNIQEARDFCKYVGEKLSVYTSDAEGACYHGIGHGAVDGSDPTAWGDPLKMIAPSLELCKKVSDTDAHFNRCASGVFNSLAILYMDPKYKLNVNLKNPFEVCEQLSDEKAKDPCYEEMNTLVMYLGGNDLAKAAKFVENITNDKYAQTAMASLSNVAPHIALDTASLKKYINICQSLQARLRAVCISGVSAGLMEFGSPGQEYVAALDFCRNTLLSANEKEACFTRVSWLISVNYPKQKRAEICASVEEKYRNLCMQN